MAASARPHSAASGGRPATPGASSAAGKRIRSDTLAPNFNNDIPRKKQQRQLPQGSCNYRDIEGGVQAPTCGCVRFWESDGADLHCVCGHHACFHKSIEALYSTTHQLAPSLRQPSSECPQYQTADPQCSFRTEAQDLRLGWQVDVQPSEPLIPAGQEIGNYEDERQRYDQRSVAPMDSDGLLPYPSMLLLDKDRQNLRRESLADAPLAAAAQSAIPEPSLQAGLGLYFKQLPAGARVPSPSPTIADPFLGMSMPESDSQIPSTRQASTTDAARHISPSSNFMRKIIESKMQAPSCLDFVETAIPAAPPDQLVDATEIATPDGLSTPAMVKFQPIFQETKRLLEAFAAYISSPAGAITLENGMAISNIKPREPESTAQLHGALQSLQERLDSYQPQNVASAQLNACIKSVLGRLDALENASFAHVSPSVFHENYEMVDTRLVEVEQQLSEHLKRIDAIENTQAAYGYGTAGSFASNGSLPSNTSSALIVSAMDRMDVDTRIEDMEARLVDLETNTLPSTKDPWEIEVVLLPWGRLLRGIWLVAADIDKSVSATATQEEEGDWQQHRNFRSSTKASSSFRSTQSGWSNQAIQAWAHHTDDWLCAKACGTNSVVYHRLRSRGLVRTITIKSHSADAIQRSIFEAFGSTLGGINSFSNPRNSSSPPVHDEDHKCFGLHAPFIPLRKKHKTSRLRFLTPAEMVTPTLWTSEFLSSGVLMRAAGGQKRLFVTTREAYMQESATTSIGWTWERIRNLPMFMPSTKTASQTGENGEAADVRSPIQTGNKREACWAHYAQLDTLPSGSSASFASFHSHASRAVRDDAQHADALAADGEEIPEDQRTVEYDMQEKTQRPIYQPITPISDFPTQILDNRYGGRWQRTVSMPATETTSVLIGSGLEDAEDPAYRPDSAGKRRIQSFEATNNPLVDLLPSFVPKNDAQALQSRKKRKIDSRAGKRRQRSVSWDLPAHQPERFEIDTEELDHYRRQLSSTKSGLTTSVLRMAEDRDLFENSSHRTVTGKRTPSFFQPTPVSRASDGFPSSQTRRRERATTEDFFADLQAVDAKGVCREVGCDHVHCTTSEGSQDGRGGAIQVASSSKGRGTTPFAYATPYSGPVTRSREENDTMVQGLMDFDDDDMTGFEYEEEELEDDESEDENGDEDGDDGSSSSGEDDDDDDDDDDESREENDGASQAWSGMVDERRHEPGARAQLDDDDVDHASSASHTKDRLIVYPTSEGHREARKLHNHISGRSSSQES